MPTAIIGTGTWGTAAACILHAQGHPAVLWGRDPAKVSTMAAARRHPQLGQRPLPADLQVTADPHALADCDLVLWAVPTQHTRRLAAALSASLPRAPVISLAKGLEQDSLLTVCQVLSETLPDRPLGVLSGPSHAVEILDGKPVALVAAGDDGVPALVQQRLHGPRCRVYTSTDRLGVELGGALKNVVAVAAGLCDGLGLGDNLKAALITRGLAEMRRLGRYLGAQDATFAGLAGIGDLLTTCYSPHGRNRALGVAIAKGESPLVFLDRQATVAEGAWTSLAAEALAQRQQVDLPIATHIAGIVWRNLPVTTAIESLLARSPKEEDA